MLALFVVVAIAVVAVVAVLVVRDRPLIEDDPVGVRALEWSGRDAVTPQALTDVRFSVSLRGYRMEEVDRVLDDTRAALAGRDARVAELLRVIEAIGGAHPQHPGPDPDGAGSGTAQSAQAGAPAAAQGDRALP